MGVITYPWWDSSGTMLGKGAPGIVDMLVKGAPRIVDMDRLYHRPSVYVPRFTFMLVSNIQIDIEANDKTLGDL